MGAFDLAVLPRGIRSGTFQLIAFFQADPHKCGDFICDVIIIRELSAVIDLNAADLEAKGLLQCLQELRCLIGALLSDNLQNPTPRVFVYRGDLIIATTISRKTDTLRGDVLDVDLDLIPWILTILTHVLDIASAFDDRIRLIAVFPDLTTHTAKTAGVALCAATDEGFRQSVFAVTTIHPAN